MDFIGIVTRSLRQLPALLIGFVGGVLYTRGVYLPMLREMRKQK